MAVRVDPTILVVRIWEPGKKSSVLPLLRQTSNAWQPWPRFWSAYSARPSKN